MSDEIKADDLVRPKKTAETSVPPIPIVDESKADAEPQPQEHGGDWKTWLGLSGVAKT